MMSVRWGTWLIGWAFTAVMLTAPAAPVSAQVANAQAVGASAELTLQTQYDSVVSLAAYRGQVVLLLYGDRHGSRHMGTYGRGLREHWAVREETPFAVLSAADLRAVPRPLRGFALRQFRQQRKDGGRQGAVLLDWRGEIADLWGARAEVANVYVFGRDGRLRWRGGGMGRPEEVAQTVQALTAALRERP
jgi:hypothetical protein